MCVCVCVCYRRLLHVDMPELTSQPKMTYIFKTLKELLGSIDDRDVWQESVRQLRSDTMIR